MINLPLATMPVRAAYSLCTLYMMLILVRWLAPSLQLSLYSPRLRWIPKFTDPLIDALRRAVPALGPFDFGPILALVVVWVIRGIMTTLLAGITFTA